MFLKKKQKSLYDYLEQPLFKWPGTNEVFRVSHALAGALVMGASRSGKTSSIYKFFLKSWFKAGYGGLLTVTRVNDSEFIYDIAKKAGREDDIVYFKHGSPYNFNILEYELNRQGGTIASTVDLLFLLHDVINKFQNPDSRGEESYWHNSANNFLTSAITLLVIARKKVSWSALRKMGRDAFDQEGLHNYLMIRENLETTEEESPQWNEAYEAYMHLRASNFFVEVFDTANELELTNQDNQRLQVCGDYMLVQWPPYAQKTRSIVKEMIISITRPFETSEILQEHFSAGFSEELDPQHTYLDGNKIVISGFGVKEYGLGGLIATTICKLAFTQAWERRDISAEGAEAQPVILAMDEFQFYLNSAAKESLYMSTAGGSLICNLMVTQNLDNVIMSSGNSNAEAKARSLVGNLSCKVFCANSNYTTNKFASDMIGRHFIDTTNTSISFENGNKQSYNQVYHPKVPTDHFTTLKTGRKENEYNVGSIVFQNGKTWKDGRNFAEITFSQKD